MDAETWHKHLHACALRNSFSSDLDLPKNDGEENGVVAVYFGSGREWPDLLTFCEARSIPIIQGSTRGVTLSKVPGVAIIDAPNLSLAIVKLMIAMPIILGKPGAMEISIQESHQEGKKDVSGTARAIAKEAEVPETTIECIRDPADQRRLGIPEQYLDGHAYHWIRLRGPGVEMDIFTRVHGRDTYAEGAIVIAQELQCNSGLTWFACDNMPLPPITWPLREVMARISGRWE